MGVQPAAMDACLDAWLGPNKADHMPDEYLLRLYVGNPDGDGVEVTGGGYAPVTLSAVDWEASLNGLIQTIAAAQFPDTTDEWDDEATHFAMCHVSTGDIWFTGPLGDGIDVSGPGDGPRVRPRLFFADKATLDT